MYTIVKIMFSISLIKDSRRNTHVSHMETCKKQTKCNVEEILKILFLTSTIENNAHLSSKAALQYSC